jgi:hypothetical protein
MVFLLVLIDVYCMQQNEIASDPLETLLVKETDYSLGQVYKMQHQLALNPKLRTKVNAVIVGLVRNSELGGMLHSINQLENSFNKEHQYPYLFLNDQPFTNHFKESIRAATNASVQFGLIPKEHWSIPDWIDKDHFRRRLKEMEAEGMDYGGVESYRHMCRWNSGFFYKHPMLQGVDYYWRVA